MTRLTAKLVVLPILERWRKNIVWLVKTVAGVGMTECRWFMSENKAREYAALYHGADVIRMSYPSGDHPTLSDDYATPGIEVQDEQA